MSLTYRSVKGTALTSNEVDENILELANRIAAIPIVTNFIPLFGTVAGSPVTGPIEIDNQSIFCGNSYLNFQSNLININSALDGSNLSNISVEQSGRVSINSLVAGAYASIRRETTSDRFMVYSKPLDQDTSVSDSDLTSYSYIRRGYADTRYALATGAGYLPLAGGVSMTGQFNLSANASSALQPVTLQQMQAAFANYENLIGGWDASGNLFPTTGGTGTSGAVAKANVWYITVAGTLGGKAVDIGDTITALINAPGQTSANWLIIEHNFSYTPVSNVLNSGQIFVGSSGNVATARALTGPIAISNTGVSSFSAGTTGAGAVVLATSPNFITSIITPSVENAGILSIGADVGTTDIQIGYGGGTISMNATTISNGLTVDGITSSGDISLNSSGTLILQTSATDFTRFYNGIFQRQYSVGVASTLNFPVSSGSYTYNLPSTSGTIALTTGSTFTSGTWQGGVIAGQYGGTGAANTGKVLLMGASVTFSGANAVTINVPNAGTNVTLPVSGTLLATSMVSGDVASMTTSGVTTLATVNGNVGSFTNANITVDAKGRITAASSGSGGSGTVTAVSIATANGISGSSSGGATPALTIVLGNITPTSSVISGTAGAGYEEFVAQSSNPSAPSAAGFRLFAGSTGSFNWRRKNGTDTFIRTFDATLTADRTYTLPDYTATLATLAGTEALTNKTYNGNTWTAGTATLTLAGNLITTGAFNTTFAQAATTTITLPSTNATMARTDAAQTFTGTQTFTVPASGTGIRTNYTSGGSVFYSAYNSSNLVFSVGAAGGTSTSAILTLQGLGTGKESGSFYFDSQDQSNSSYAAFGCSTSGGFFGVTGYTLLTSSKNGTGTQLPFSIGGYNGSYTHWLQITTSGLVSVPNTTAATSSTGAFTVSGGILTNTLYCSGNSVFNNTVTLNNVTAATGTSTGALRVAGGISANQGCYFNTIQTVATTNGSGVWKLGKVVTATVVADTTTYVEVEIDGTTVKLMKAA